MRPYALPPVQLMYAAPSKPAAHAWAPYGPPQTKRKPALSPAPASSPVQEQLQEPPVRAEHADRSDRGLALERDLEAELQKLDPVLLRLLRPRTPPTGTGERSLPWRPEDSPNIAVAALF